MFLFCMKILSILMLLFFTISCGGGGGGTTTTSSSTSSLSDYRKSNAVALNFTTSLTDAPLMSSHFKSGFDSGLYAPSKGSGTVGSFTVNASTDNFSISQTNYWATPNIGHDFTTSDVYSTTTYSNSYTLGSTVYEYAFTTGANTYFVDIDVPDNYSYQTWFYWNDAVFPNVNSYNSINFGVTGIYTETNNLPNSGTATYSGGMYGNYKTGGNVYALAGDAIFAVNWGTEQISGGFQNVVQADTEGNLTTIGDFPMVDVSGNPHSVSISSGNFESGIQGPSFNAWSVGATSIAGDFFGPTGQEIGGVWDFYKNNDWNGTAVGYFAAKRN